MTLHEDLADAWRARGLNVVDVQPASGRRDRPNPTTVTIGGGSGKVQQYQVFAWRTTHEGKTRKNDNLRVQGTNFGATNSPVAINRAVVAVGYSEPHQVFFGFDAWVKRNLGRSSSVHVTRDLIEAAAASGLETGGHQWDPRVAFTAAHAEELLPWVARLWDQKQVSVRCLESKILDADLRVVRVDPHPRSSPAANSVRVDDRVAVFDSSGEHPDDYLWRVKKISVVPITLESGLNRYHFDFEIKRSAKATGKLEKP